ncbi:MAG: cation:proton antiporter [Desulfobacterales bacterium]|nr:cation:proton antiporter [Desulfobacterales bacterium]
MDAAIFNNPALTIALALVVGIGMQAIAHHIRVPGIVLLLAAGVVCGPDGLGIIRPETLGPALNIIIGFAVAVILFEGGLSLRFSRLKQERRSIRYLILIGGAITVAGGAVSARFILGWPWQTAALFGTLVMVTGPTVINPLLKRLKVKRSVATVLEAEGVMIDAIGAVVAIVALEAALSPAHSSPAIWLWHVISRLGFGMICGAVIGMVLVWAFRVRRLIPEGTENVFTLCTVLGLYQASNAILPESGIAAVTMAGVMVGNFGTHFLEDLSEFKEELTVMLIGMLFVLLAADVRMEQVQALGWPGVATVLALMLVVRPAAVFAGTQLSELNWREKLFIAWIGPRGIVAAAVASLFAAGLINRGMPGGYELRALVFLVIAATVLSAGLTGGIVASILGVRRPSNFGWVIMGANELGRAVAKLLKESGQEVLCIDANTQHCRAAEGDCTRVICGNALHARYLARAEIDTRKGAIALTPNEEVNYLFLQRVKAEIKEIYLFSALQAGSTSLTEEMISRYSTEVVFGVPVDVDLWTHRFQQRQVLLQKCAYAGGSAEEFSVLEYSPKSLILAGVFRGGALWPVGSWLKLKKGDEAYFFVYKPDAEAVDEYLSGAGWEPLERQTEEYFSTSICELVENR